MAEVKNSISDYFVVGEPLILINIQRSLAEGLDEYEGVRRAWWVDFSRVRNKDGSYKLVLARDRNRVVGAYRPTDWYRDQLRPNRKAFDGLPADQSTWAQYVGKLVPERFLPLGARNPVRHLYPGE